MSRYSVDPYTSVHDVIVGWDEGFLTFFARVEPHANCETNELLVWLGTERSQVKTVEQLANAVGDYAVIPVHILQALQHDKNKSLG